MDLGNKKPLIAGVGVIGIAIVAWLAFGFFGIQAAFIDNEVSEGTEDLFAAAPAQIVDSSGSEDAADELVEEEAPVNEVTQDEAPAEEEPVEEAAEEAPAEEAPVEEAPAEETAPAEDAPVPVEEAAPVEEAPTEEAAPAEEAAPVEEAPAEETAAPGEIVTISSGNFVSLNGYSVAGDALVLNNGTEQRFLRFENFVSDNGPDLKVYLRAASGEFISLGDLSGNIGDQNYEIPVDVDLSVFSSVEIWCERFSRGFGAATLG